ncbi:hypothetical protein R1flu_003042 [Riccia fluitans]|uniref:Large ribosomal subunit protein bL32m n=1 Tax=Riccia fluitans TaxID=41844 RepID=A0ABD1YAW4_9MARC
MTIVGLQRQAVKIVQKFAAPLSTRAHHSVTEFHQHQSSMGVAGPKFFSQSEDVPDAPRFDNSGDSNTFFRNPFMDLMAVPKRKVSPSRKGKRNGPKAYKPVTVIAKCKVCGRVKLPHLYCCSGEIKSLCFEDVLYLGFLPEVAPELVKRTASSAVGKLGFIKLRAPEGRSFWFIITNRVLLQAAPLMMTSSLGSLFCAQGILKTSGSSASASSIVVKTGADRNTGVELWLSKSSNSVAQCTCKVDLEEDKDLRIRGGAKAAESQHKGGTTLNRRVLIALPLMASNLRQLRASAALLAEIAPAPYNNPLLRSLGIGDPDIYYPPFFEGTWNCYSTLIEVVTPQGEDKADQKSVEFSRKQLGYTVPYQVRFTPFEGRVICDRLFTTTSLVEATVGKNVIEEGQWNPAKPNRLVLVLKGGTKVENLVTKRSAEYFQKDQFDTSEFSKQVFDYSAVRDGPPSVKASQNLTRYHWDLAASAVSKMEAIQKVSMFAVPMEGMEMFNTTTPVTVYKYRIEFERI